MFDAAPARRRGWRVTGRLMLCLAVLALLFGSWHAPAEPSASPASSVAALARPASAPGDSADAERSSTAEPIPATDAAVSAGAPTAPAVHPAVIAAAPAGPVSTDATDLAATPALVAERAPRDADRSSTGERAPPRSLG